MDFVGKPNKLPHKEKSLGMCAAYMNACSLPRQSRSMAMYSISCGY